MKIREMMGGKRPLASAPKPTAAAPAPEKESALAKIKAPIRRPGDFGVQWPTVPRQEVKDYKAILTLADLEAYLDRCIETGLASFDWETAATQETRQRWQAWLTESKNRELAAEYLDRAKMCREYTPDTAYLEALTAKQRAAEVKKRDKVAETEAKEWEARAAELEAEYKAKRKAYLESPLDPWAGDICTASIAAAPHEARVIPIDHKAGKVFEPHLSREKARQLVMDTLDRKLFRNKDVTKIAVNLAFETKYAAKHKKYILGRVADPLVMWVRCLQTAAPKRIKDPKRPVTGWGLKPATKEIFGVILGDFMQLLEKHQVEFFDEIDACQGDGLVYSAEDSDYGLQQYLYWSEVAKQIPNYYEWLHNIEMPFGRVIGLMEYWGMNWDTQLANIKRQEAENAQDQAALEIKHIVKEAFDLDVNVGKAGKTNEIKHVLFDLMKLPAAKWGKPTKSGERNVSIDEEALIDMSFMLENNLVTLDEEKYLAVELPEGWQQFNEFEIAAEAPVIQKAIEIRKREPHPYRDQALQLLGIMKKIQKYSTLLSSHIIGREKFLNEISGRIHASYSPFTETARLKSEKPNGQNVPRTDNDEFKIRNFYVPGPGKILFFIDFSGFELRILAWKAGDQVMIELFNTGGDMHRKTASEMTEKPEEQITKDERRDAKPANFGIAYGGTEHALQGVFKTDYGIRKTLDECLSMVNAVKRAYPGVPIFQQEVARQAKEDGYVSTMYGYIRMLPDIGSAHRGLRQSAERQASNTPIQGTAADIMKRAQNEVYDEIGAGTVARAEGFAAAPSTYPLAHGSTDMIAQIHDEIIFEMDDDPDVVEAAWKWVQATMEKEPLPGFPVKIEAEASVGYAWGNKMSVEEWLKMKREGATA